MKHLKKKTHIRSILGINIKVILEVVYLVQNTIKLIFITKN